MLHIRIDWQDDEIFWYFNLDGIITREPLENHHTPHIERTILKGSNETLTYYPTSNTSCDDQPFWLYSTHNETKRSVTIYRLPIKDHLNKYTMEEYYTEQIFKRSR